MTPRPDGDRRTALPGGPPSAEGARGGPGELRLTWVQPEDLIGHELRQAAEDGREASGVAAVWHTAGGPPHPGTAGASSNPASPELRALALRLLDELALLPSPLAPLEPTDLPAIRAACPHWPQSPGERRRLGGRQGLGERPSTGPAGARVPIPSVPGPTAGREAAPGSGSGSGSGSGRETGIGMGMGVGMGTTTGTGTGGAPDPDPRTGGGAHTDAATAPRPGDLPTAPAPGAPGPEALHAAWLGRAAGCLLGKPVEKLPLRGIRALARATGNWPLNTWFTAVGVPAELARKHPWNRRSAGVSLAENIDGMPEDDDLNYPLLNLLLLQRHGRGFTTADVARLWLDELPAGRTFTAERIAYRNLLSGLEPPLTARRHNPFREWIGAAIRADVHGWTCPGDPGAAAEQAHRDAVLTHTANGVYGAMFVAAATAAAAGGVREADAVLAAGLTVVPPGSRLAGAVRTGIGLARAESSFDTVVDRLHTAYGHHHWVHSVPNAALLAAALTHAGGDFTGSVCRAVSGGWDTDSNGATAGALAGLIAGRPEALPERWTAPLDNRLSTSVAGFDGIGFDTLARLTHEEAIRP